MPDGAGVFKRYWAQLDAEETAGEVGTVQYLRRLAKMFEIRTERQGSSFRHRVFGGHRWLVVIVREQRG